MTSEVFLDKKFFLAKGGERDCYINPFDNKKVIKIVHRKEKHNEQNKLEYKYYNYLKKKSLSLEHIAKCYGFIDTNKGKGLIYERVFNYDNTPSKSFKYYLTEKKFSKKYELMLVSELKKYLFENKILFIDVDLSNVFCQEYSKNNFKLIIIDGLGARRLNWRFYLYLKSERFTIYKIRKQWKKFYSNYLKFSTY